MRLKWAAAITWVGLCALLGCGKTSEPPPPPPGTDSPAPAPPPGPEAPQACARTSCEAQGKNCGAIPDGCGGTVDCGSCTGRDSCGGGGVPNLCGAPAHPGQERWQAVIDGPGSDFVLSLATDGQGNSFALAIDSRREAQGASQVPISIVKLDSVGRAVWTRTFGRPGKPFEAMPRGLAISPSGDIFVHYTIDCAEHPCEGGSLGGAETKGALLVKLSPSGDFLWQQPSGGTFARDVSVDAAGSALVLDSNFLSQPALAKFASDGTFLWSRPAEAARSAAFNPSGNILVGTTGAPALLEKLDPNGQPLWSQPIAGDNAQITSIGASAAGTVVAVGQFNRNASWGGQNFTDRSGNGYDLLLTAEANGQPRWARQLNAQADSPAIAIDPEGQVAVLASDQFLCAATSVFKYNLAGDFLWSRRFPSSGCATADNGAFGASAAVAQNHDVLVGGNWWGAMDFGNGPALAQGRAGFVLDLGP